MPTASRSRVVTVLCGVLVVPSLDDQRCGGDIAVRAEQLVHGVVCKAEVGACAHVVDVMQHLERAVVRAMREPAMNSQRFRM